MIVDLASRATALTAHYTDYGVLTRATALQQLPVARSWSLYLLTGSSLGVAALFVVAAACALAFALGRAPLLTGAASWVLLMSLQARNPLVSYGGDTLLHLLMFFGTFALAAARLRERVEVPGARCGVVLSGATAALLLQVGLLYVFAGLLKTGEPWKDGTAVDIVLQTELGTRLGHWLYALAPGAFSSLTLVVVPFEIFGPLLLFVPLRFGVPRMLGVAAFLGLHLGFATLLSIGLFPLFSFVALTPFVPPWFWDHPVAWLTRRAGGLWHTIAGRAARLGRGLGAVSRRRAVAAIDVFALACVVLAAAWNVGTWRPSAAPLPRWAASAAVWLGLNQEWMLFAPAPTRALSSVEVWGAAAGQAEPRLVTPYSGHQLEGDSEPYSTHRWRKLMEALRREEAPRLYSEYLDYVCRRAQDDGAPLEYAQIVFVRQLMSGAGFGPPKERRHAYEHTCR